MARTVFNIEIINWEKHNGGMKKGYRYFMLDTRFFEDSKISQLTPLCAAVFIKLLCSAGDLNTKYFSTHAGLLPKCWPCSDLLLEKCLKTLQSFQLLTYEKKDPLYNIRENKEKKNRIEGVSDTENDSLCHADQKLSTFPIEVYTKKEENLNALESTSSGSNFVKNDKKLNAEIWAAYFEAYVSRYDVEPVRNATVNSQVSKLAARLGPQAIEVVRFYLDHPKLYYIRQTHNIGACLADCESLRTQMLMGKPITENDLKDLSKKQEDADLRLAIKEGRI